MADERASTYMEEGTRVWRASSFGYCEQYLTRVALGQTPAAPPENIVRAMGESAAMEGDVLAELSARGWRVFDQHDLSTKMHGVGKVDARTGQLQTEMTVPGGVIRCHPDGIVQCFKDKVGEDLVGTCAVVEIKCLKKGSWARPLEKEAYAWQGSIEAVSVGLPLLFVVAWKDDEGLVYDGDGLDLTITRVELNKLPHSKAEIIGRAAKLNRMVREAEEGGGLPACDFKMFPCGFWQEHDVSAGVWKKSGDVELDADVEANVRFWAYKYDEAREKEAAAKKDKSKAGGKLKEMLEAAGMESGQKAVTDWFDYAMVESRTTKMDEKKAERDGVDLEKYKVSTPYTFVKVTHKGEK